LLDFPDLWSNYSSTSNPRALLPILAHSGRTKNKEELGKAIEELKVRKIKDFRLTELGVKVARGVGGSHFGRKVLKELVFNGNYGESLDEKIQVLSRRKIELKNDEVKSLYEELKSNPKSQTEVTWSNFASICVQQSSENVLQLLKREFKEAVELPLVRLSIALSLSSAKKKNLGEIWSLLEPLEKMLDNPSPHPLALNAFISYFIATKNQSKLRELLSKMSPSNTTQGKNFALLRVASFLGDTKKAEEIFSLLKTKNEDANILLIRAYAIAGNFEQAKELFDAFPNKTGKSYIRMARIMHFLRSPLEERRELLRLMKESRIRNSKPYFFLLKFYYNSESNAGEDSRVLKDLLSRMNKIGLLRGLDVKQIESILQLCVKTKDMQLFSQYFRKLKELGATDSVVQKWAQYEQTFDKTK
jgi:hypothetical protein